VKATFLHGPLDLRVAEIEDAEPGPGEVVLEVGAVGICGSDLHTYSLGNVGGIAPKEPLTLGHEASGTIIALGPGVDPERYKIGQLVAIDPATPCGECEPCQAGDPHLCLRLKFIGLYPFQGAMREHFVHEARSCVPLPESITPIGAAMLEPLGVALHAARLAAVQVGDDVVVIGCGGIGLLIVRLVRLAGARRIFAVDKYDWRLDLASNYGADVLINADQVDTVSEILRRTGGRGVDVALEAAWVEGTASQCVEVARMGGRVVIVGIPAEDVLSVRASAARRKELTILYSRRMKHAYPPSIALAVSGKVDVDGLASHVYPLDRVNEAFDVAATYKDGVVRAVVVPKA
jgi:L-iditol 2-dehydrogenase